MKVKTNLDRQKAVIFLVMTAILWSLGGMLIKLIEWNPMAIAGMRSAIAAIVLLIFLRRPNFTWSFPQIGGAIAYAGTVTLFVTANKLTTATNAVLLQYTAPIYIALFSKWFLGEKTTRLDWITIIAVLAGMVLFFLDELTTGNLVGNICAIASSITFAWLALFMRKQKSGSPLESILLGNILAGLIGLPFMFESNPSYSSWLGLILLGVVQLGIPYILYSKAIKHVTALEAMLIPTLEPVLNPIWVLISVGEIPGKWALAGGLIVLASVTIRGIITIFNSRSYSTQKL
jgi:drug/metabolite transporter (DMT)-like permease